MYTYLVDEDGCINFPIIGKVHVAGLTRQEISKKLESKISRKLVVLGMGLCVALAFSSCKSSESAYKKGVLHTGKSGIYVGEMVLTLTEK